MSHETMVYREGYGVVTKSKAREIDAARKPTAVKLDWLDKRPERGSWVMRNGKLIPKHLAAAEAARSVQRSDLPCPYVVPDVPEHRNMATGEMVTSRSRHREILKEHNLIEIGNEAMPTTRDLGPKKGEIAKEIKETIEQLEQGYQFEPEEKFDSCDEVSFTSADVDVSKPDTPQYVRSEAK